jgi:hypothetical protein
MFKITRPRDSIRRDTIRPLDTTRRRPPDTLLVPPPRVPPPGRQ